jgi:NAD(P)-dependent dehydrogenase (short-subunit alcohol dehydrogenase family)
VIAVNLTAPLILTAQLLARGALPPGARLVLVGSLSSFTGYPGAAVYAGTKDGLRTLAASLRRPLARQGVRVQLVTPGPMDTPHAAAHAPPGASGRGRSDPARIARLILDRPRPAVLIPGLAARALATLGRVAPGLATGLMRRAIYDRYADLPDPPQERAPE